MRILFVCRRFDNVAGGVERMATTLMNGMQARGHEVSLLTWDSSPDARSFYPMDSAIVWHKIAMGDPARKAGWWLRIKRALKVRALLRDVKPDVVLAFQDGPFMAIRLFGMGMGIPMIAAERNSPFRHAQIKSFPPFAVSCQMMRLATAITVQFERYRTGYPSFLHRKIVSIPNHVAPARRVADPAGAGQAPKILLGVGRLSSEKNFPALIEAFSRLSVEFPDWVLRIVGEGARRGDIEAQISALPPEVRGRIELTGASTDVPSFLSAAHVFCMPSLWEGFPNALAEAMAHGLPCVGFESCAGVSDLIAHGKTGLLAPGDFSVDSLVDSLRSAMADPALRVSLGAAAREAMRAYEPERVFDQWEALFSKVCAR